MEHRQHLKVDFCFTFYGTAFEVIDLVAMMMMVIMKMMIDDDDDNDNNDERNRLFVDSWISGKEAVDVLTWTNATLIRLLQLEKKLMKENTLGVLK